MPIYMQIDGIKGNVTAKGHEGWIEILTFDHSVNRTITTHPGYTYDREASAPTINEAVMSKLIDSTSPKLFGLSTVGKSLDKVVIDFTKTGDELTTFLTYTLANVMVSSYNVTGTNSALPNESITINFTKLEIKFTPFDPKDSQQSAQSASYDVSTAAAAG